MTCASCVNKVEKALNSVKGVVHADVNFATERASVEYIPEEVSIRDLKKAVEEAGYQVLEVKEEDIVEKERLAREAELSRLKLKVHLRGDPPRSHPYFSCMVAPSSKNGLDLSQEVNFFLQFLLATPVQFWAGWQFYVGFLEGDET